MRLNITTQHYDRALLLAILFLCAFGTVMLYSASWNESYIRSGGLTESLFLKNHIKRIILGFTMLFLFLKIDYKNLKSIATYFLIVTFFLLIITKLYYKILGINSPARWLYLGFFSIQTSDVARLSLMLFLAFYLEKKKNQITKQEYEDIIDELSVFTNLIVDYIIVSECVNLNTKENE